MATSDILDNQDKRFTSELCQFLTSLAKTPETNFEGLSSDLTRLRDALLQEVDTKSEESKSRRGSEDSTGGESSSGSGTDQNMSTSSQDNSPARDRQGSSGSNNSSSTGNDSTTSSASDSTLSSSSSASVQSDNNNEEADIPFNKLGLRSHTRIQFSLQSGVKYDLNNYDLGRAFSQFGRVRQVNIKQGPGRYDCWDGHIDFYNSRGAELATGKVVQVKDCQVFAFPSWSALTDNPVPNMILLESRYLPNIWEKNLVVRSFFTKFGSVQGVMHLGQKKSGIRGFVVAFKDEKPAQELIGQSVKILSSTVFIREVTKMSVKSW